MPITDFVVEVVHDRRLVRLTCRPCDSVLAVELTSPGFAEAVALFCETHAHATEDVLSSTEIDLTGMG